MTEKEKIIFNILKSELPKVSKLGKEQKEIFDNIDKDSENGEIHPNNVTSMKTGTSYTHGYCVGQESLLKRVMDLLQRGVDEIKESLLEEEKIKEENKKRLNKLTSDILKGRK